MYFNLFQMLQVLFQPSVRHVVAVQLDEDQDEDAEGDPEDFHRQLRRIRRGETVERLKIRLR